MKELAERFYQYSITNDLRMYSIVGFELKDDQKQEVEDILREYYQPKEIHWLDMPSSVIGGKSIVPVSYLMREGEDILTGKVIYLYSINVSPEVYEPGIRDFLPIDSKGVVLGNSMPVVYDGDSLEPHRDLTLRIRVESQHDLELLNPDFNYRQYLLEQFEKFIDNVDDYKQTGYRKLMIRCYIEE